VVWHLFAEVANRTDGSKYHHEMLWYHNLRNKEVWIQRARCQLEWLGVSDHNIGSSGCHPTIQCRSLDSTLNTPSVAKKTNSKNGMVDAFDCKRL
jgi:hypothetical protein